MKMQSPILNSLVFVIILGATATAQELSLNWTADGKRFWYQVGGASGKEFRVASVVDKESRPAFDHARVKQIIQEQFEIADPSIQRIEMLDDPNLLIVKVRSRYFRVDVRDYSITETERPESIPEDYRLFRRKVRSVDGQQTSLTVKNNTSNTLEINWVDRSGGLVSYGKIESGKAFETGTWAGHVWRLATADGLTSGYFETRVNDEVIIDEEAFNNIQPGGLRTSRRRRSKAAEAKRFTSGRWNKPRVSPAWKTSIRNHNLWLVPSGDNSANSIQLTRDGSKDDSFLRIGSGQRWNPEDPNHGSGHVQWSPDARHLIAWQTRPVAEPRVQYIESSPSDRLQPKLRSYQYPKPGDKLPVNRLHLFSVADGKEIPVDHALFSNPFSLRIVDWSEDGNHFWLYYNQRGHQVLRILEVSVEDGSVRTIVEETSPTFIHYSGNGKYVLEHLSESDMLWASERSGWNHLYRIDKQSGEVLNTVTTGQWNVRTIEKIDREKKVIWFYAVGIQENQDPYHRHFCRVNFDGSGLTVLTEGDGTHQVQFEQDDRFILDTWSRVDLGPVTELRDAQSGQLVAKLNESNTESLFGERRLTTRVKAKGRDGVTDIWGIIHWPKGFDPKAKYPVIESIYAGPHDHHVPKRFRRRYGQHRIADAGFIVVQIDGMGTAWRSKKFHDVCFKNLRDAGFPDRIEWIKAAAKQFPQMDISRVGIYGGSAGGQNAMAALLWHNDFYDVAVADCGCHDNRMDKIWWNEQWMGWPIGEHYKTNSNMENAHLLKGQLMLTVGEMDRNVDPASTTQVVKKLIEANKDFEFVLLPGQGHGSGESPWAARKRLNFFIRHLKDDVRQGDDFQD